MEFLIFFVFWHKNSVIFREIFASGGGGENQIPGGLQKYVYVIKCRCL